MTLGDHPMNTKRQPILTLSWNSIHDAIDSLTYQIKPLRPILLVAISRGGLIPATLLSHKLNCPVEVISASAYEGTRRTLQKPIIIDGWLPGYNDPRTIVIDDILDSGDTYAALLNKAGGVTSKFKFATLITKTPKRFTNHNLNYAQVPKEVWVKFPWEGDIE